MYFLRSSFASIATGKERTWSELGTNLVRTWYEGGTMLVWIWRVRNWYSMCYDILFVEYFYCLISVMCKIFDCYLLRKITLL